MASKGNSSQSLSEAKTAKKDEFYTALDVVSAEMRYHRKFFEGKTVLCNCDDPFESNFFKYFALNFNKLKLKRLIATCYKGSPVVATQLSWIPGLEASKELNSSAKKKAYKIVITEVPDVNGDGAIDITDVEWLIKHGNNVLTELNGDGDFRSEECLALLDECDVVCTNPPFSLFREYMAKLVECNKSFIILGNVNAITYREIFPLIKSNKLWMGASIHSGDREFRVPDDYPLKASGYRVDEEGNKYIRVKGVRWWTNIDYASRHEELDLYKKYSPEEYPRYDNYDAIEVGKTAEIPRDYFGIMGVPITFLDKYCPEQFEILGSTQRGCHDEVPDTKKYDDYWEVRPDGTKTGSSGGKTNENGNLERNDGKHNYFINKEGHIVQSAYGRLFIKRKDTE